MPLASASRASGCIIRLAYRLGGEERKVEPAHVPLAFQPVVPGGAANSDNVHREHHGAKH